MAIANRLKRLETAVARNHEPGQRTFEQFMADHLRLFAWLDERGYPDHLAALEAGETGPDGLESLLREQAAYDPKRRAWKRIEKALNAGQLPDNEDLEALTNPARLPNPASDLRTNGQKYGKGPNLGQGRG